MYLSGVTLHDSLFGGANEQAPNQQDGVMNRITMKMDVRQ